MAMIQRRYLWSGRTIVLVLAGVLSGPPAAATEEVFAPDACPTGIPCLEATISLAREPGEEPTVEHFNDPDERFGQVVFATRGRLKGRAERAYRLRIRAYGDGIACTIFGQSNVALLGFSPTGNPVIHTTAGPLEIADDVVAIGCWKCLRLKKGQENKPFATFDTPAWALHLAGLSAEDFTWTEDGQAYVRSGDACIRLGQRELFRFAPADRCARRPEFKGLNPETDMSEEGPDWILKIEGSDVTGYLYNGACT